MSRKFSTPGLTIIIIAKKKQMDHGQMRMYTMNFATLNFFHQWVHTVRDTCRECSQSQPKERSNLTTPSLSQPYAISCSIDKDFIFFEKLVNITRLSCCNNNNSFDQIILHLVFINYIQSYVQSWPDSKYLGYFQLEHFEFGKYPKIWSFRSGDNNPYILRSKNANVYRSRQHFWKKSILTDTVMSREIFIVS